MINNTQKCKLSMQMTTVGVVLLLLGEIKLSFAQVDFMFNATVSILFQESIASLFKYVKVTDKTFGLNS